LIEEYINFDKEFSIIGCKNSKNEFVYYDTLGIICVDFLVKYDIVYYNECCLRVHNLKIIYTLL